MNNEPTRLQRVLNVAGKTIRVIGKTMWAIFMLCLWGLAAYIWIEYFKNR